MKTVFLCYSLAGVFSLSVNWVCAQNADVVPTQQRQITVDLASAVLSHRNAPVEVPDPAPNPFEWPAEAAAPVVAIENIVAPPVESMNLALLAKIAGQMAVTGTASIGGRPILLMGQKRLKVGDNLTIAFEGNDYDISITSISLTSFTIKRGDFTYTRPTRISSSSSRP